MEIRGDLTGQNIRPDITFYRNVFKGEVEPNQLKHQLITLLITYLSKFVLNQQCLVSTLLLFKLVCYLVREEPNSINSHAIYHFGADVTGSSCHM